MGEVKYVYKSVFDQPRSRRDDSSVKVTCIYKAYVCGLDSCG